MEISADDFNKNDGIRTILDKLDSVFLKEEKDCQYHGYTEFDRIKREHGIAMADYIIEFECKYIKQCNCGMIIPDAVLAFKLLGTAGLDVKDKQLVLTACSTLTFLNMKSALKFFFGENHIQMEVKLKMNLSTNMSGDLNVGCVKAHITVGVKDCPHKGENSKLTEDIEQCNITLFSQDNLSDTEIYMVESLWPVVTDAACIKTVCGQKWLDYYISGLKSAGKKL